ncbi:MAG TPA: 50S ribosomal protein L10 [Anaerolineae bacterium]|nr:50S ribosomal protein L10 [Anaerolineae bacterium]
MAISRTRKEELVVEYRQQYAQSVGIMLADYKSLTTHQIDSLRQRAREQQGQVFVVKNTLLSLVLTEAGVKSADKLLVGPTLAVFCHKDISAIAKLARDFTKEVEEGRFAVKGGVLEGHLLNAAQAQAVADMPSREVMLAQVLRTINAPASQMVGVVAGGIRQILNVVKAYADKLEGAGSAEAAA